MKIRIMGVLALMSLSSCQVYNSTFDCPPCRGVPCTSVSDIQKRIIETPEGGTDIFLDVPIHQCESKPCRSIPKVKGNCSRRIWIEDSNCHQGSVQGHYIYFSEDTND